MSAYRKSHRMIARHCKAALAGKLKKICLGNYTAEMLYKYKDGLMTVGAEYGIFQVVEEPNVYFVAMGKTRLNSCETFTITNGSHYECNSLGTVSFAHDQLICLPFQFGLTNDMIKECTTKKVPVAAYTVLHYPFRTPESMIHITRSTSSVCSWEPMMLLGIILSLFLIWIFQRWRK